MSDKRWCPACDAATSNITSAFRNGEPCPYCGLPAHVAEALLEARERGASEQLVEQCAKAELRATKAEAETARVRALLDTVKRAVAAAEVSA